jgi:hypothetical protein
VKDGTELRCIAYADDLLPTATAEDVVQGSVTTLNTTGGDNGRVALVNYDRHVKEPRPEAIRVSLEQIHDEWPRTETAGVKKEKPKAI